LQILCNKYVHREEFDNPLGLLTLFLFSVQYKNFSRIYLGQLKQCSLVELFLLLGQGTLDQYM